MTPSLEHILEVQCAIALLAVAFVALGEEALLLAHAPLEQDIDQSNADQGNDFATKRDGVAHDVPGGVVDGIDLGRGQARSIGQGDEHGDGNGTLVVGLDVVRDPARTTSVILSVSKAE